jgi:flavin-dependent dehydrogenase
MHRCRTGELELMEKHTLHVSIIGGGIGGLAAASALLRQGIGVTVFERNPELREIGAGGFDPVGQRGAGPPAPGSRRCSDGGQCSPHPL